MNIEKADYFAICAMGNVDLLKRKIDMNHDSIAIINKLRVSGNMSLLQVSLSYRKFDISKYLLGNNADVNVITNESYNELHLIAANLGNEKVIEIAKILVLRGVDLNLKDKKYKNTPFWYFCMEAVKKIQFM